MARRHLSKLMVLKPCTLCHWRLWSVSKFFFQIIIAGDRDSQDTKDLLKCVHSHYMPNKVLMLCDGKQDGFLASKLSVFKTLERKDGKATAYVCENYTCSLPVNSVDELEKILSK